MKRLLFLLSWLPVLAWAQPTSATADFDFALYLVGSGFKEDAATLLRHYRPDGDSISFVKGYVLYSNHQLDSAVHYLSSVGSQSQLFAEARFYGALSAAHDKRYHDAAQLLQPLRQTDDPAVRNLYHFEQAGIGLLQRDLRCFDSCYALLQPDDFRIASEVAALAQLRAGLPLKNKSPWVAAGLSAVVPGLGKVYAGRPGEGVSAFLIVGSLMAATAENAYKEGWTNWKTLLFGSLSTVFYLGNIYGSAVSVRVGMDDRNNQTDVQILYHIHIPLRNSYRR